MKKKLLFAAAMMLAAVGAKAQTDVTSTYLTNADFSQGTPIDNHVCGYGKDMAKNGTNYYGFQAVDGWSYEVLAGVTDEGGFTDSGMGGAVFAYGSEWQLKGNNTSAPATNPAGEASGNCLGFFGVWGNGGYYYQEVELPAGGYTLTIPIYNQSGTQGNTSYTGFIPDEGTSYTTAINTTVGQWTTKTIKFTLTAETKGKIALGYKSTGGGSAANPMLFFDGVSITYTDPLQAVKADYEAALADAKAAMENPAYSNVNGNEKSNLASVISATPEATEAGYIAATEALNTATTAFLAAKASYDELAEINAAAAKLGIDALSAESAEEAIAQAHVQNVAVYNKVNEDFTFPVTLGSWTQTGATKNEKGQHWNGDATTTYYEPNQWGSASVDWAISQTIAALPAGDYVLMATGRRSGDITMTMTAAGESVTTFPNADFGLGVDTSGAANFGEGTFAADGQGRGWQWRYIPFTLTEAGDVEIKVTATAPSTHQWASITEFKLLAKPEAETAIAKAELLAAINNATAINDGVNVGTEAFQIPASAATDLANATSDAQTVYDNEDATLEDVQAAIQTLAAAVSAYYAVVINAPADGDVFNVILAENGGWTYDGKAMTLRANDRNGQGNYNFQYQDLNVNYAQSLTFTQVEGNNYTISISADAEGAVRYVTTGIPYGGNSAQIRTSTNAEDAAIFTIIPTATEGIWNIYNVEAKNYVGSQDAGVYTVNSHINFQIVKNMAKPEVDAISLAAGKFATRIYPFKPTANANLKYYSCAANDGSSLTLVEETELAANTPYIIEAIADVEEAAQTGVGAAFQDKYTKGYLTGTFASVEIPAGNYILQTKEGVGQRFFLLEPAETAYMSTLYRAYLTVPASEGVKAYTLNGDATAISTIEALTSGNFEGIYNAAGAKINRMEKGVNIIRMTDGTTRKVMIK
jgi:hypothetical protein